MKILTEQDKQNYLEWCEGNKYLYELLCACGENEITTFASCGGHEKGKKDSPYLGIIINTNSLPFIKRILSQLQDMQNIIITSGVRHYEGGKLLDDEELRSLAFYAHNYNCCEMFYKMKKGIENKDNEIVLSPKADRFYELLKRLNATSREELQADVNNNIISGITFATKTQEFIDFENSKKMVRNSKLISFFRRLLPFKNLNNTKYEQLQQKYGFLQREYPGERSTKMEQYIVDNLNSKIERNAVLQNGDIAKESQEIKKGKEQENGER